MGSSRSSFEGHRLLSRTRSAAKRILALLEYFPLALSQDRRIDLEQRLERSQRSGSRE
jgi:hypothetical protein